MSKDDVVGTLQGNGFDIVSENRLGNDTGWQLRLQSGQIVNVYDKGTVQVQGKGTEEVKELLGLSTSPTAAEGAPAAMNSGAGERSIFVVYGHDEEAKTTLEAMLRRWGLNPLILDQLPSGGQTIIEKLESVSGKASFAVVLATPDDEGHRAGHDEEKKFGAVPDNPD